MGLPAPRVEGAAKIAMRPPPDRLITAGLLPSFARQWLKFSLRKFVVMVDMPGPNRYPGANPKVRSKRAA
jgi:hypothetical protein